MNERYDPMTCICLILESMLTKKRSPKERKYWVNPQVLVHKGRYQIIDANLLHNGQFCIEVDLFLDKHPDAEVAEFPGLVNEYDLIETLLNAEVILDKKPKNLVEFSGTVRDIRYDYNEANTLHLS